MSNADMVREFHEAFGLSVREKPIAEIPEWLLREELIREELEEYILASGLSDIIGIADALADLLYVVYGAALAHGIPIDAVFAEVHRSNMTKLGKDGKPIKRADGKILKGEDWKPPDIQKIFSSLGGEEA